MERKSSTAEFHQSMHQGKLVTPLGNRISMIILKLTVNLNLRKLRLRFSKYFESTV